IPNVSADYDGDYRPIEGGPDLGADEFMMVPCMAPVVTSQPQSHCSCEGESVTFSIANTGSATVNYQWKKNGNIIASSNNSFLTLNQVGMGDAGSYSVIIYNSCGIDSSAVVTLTVNARPTALISGTANICNGQSVALNISVSGNSNISGILSDGSSFSGNAPNISVTKFPTSNTTYTVSSVSDNHCSAMPADLSGSAVVTVNARPTAVISGSATICNGQNVSLTLTVSGAGTIYGTLSDGTPFSGTAPTILVVVTPSNNITYTIATLNDTNCMALAQDKTGSAIISVNQRPTSVISGSTTICNGQSVSIPIAVSGSGTISGTLSDGTVFSGTAPTIYAGVSPVANTNYVVNSLSNAVCTAQSADMIGTYSVNVNPALVAYHTVFSEDFGTAYALPASWSSSPSYYWTAEWASASTGYTGASGYSNAVAHNNDPQDLSLISPAIDFSNYSSGKLTFGMRKTATFIRDIALEVSTDNFATVAYSKTILNANFPSTTYWGLITINLGSYIDHASSVKIRWRLLGGPAGSTGNIRIDDVVLSSGTPVISPAGPITICSGGNVTLSSSAGSSFLWSPNNETTQSIQVNTSGSYSVQVNGCATSQPTVVTIVSTLAAPTGNAAQSFCYGATVNDLVATGVGIKWYDAAIGGNLLAGTTALSSANYYASQSLNGCESMMRFEVTANLTTPTAPIGLNNQAFVNVVTVADLVAIGNDIKWYDAPVGGNLLSPTDILTDGHTYYASQTIAGCESQNRLSVTVTLLLVKTVNLHLFLQGLFNYNTNNCMVEAQDIDWGTGYTFAKYGNGIADRIQVDLYNENSPYSSAGVSISGIDLSTSGLASFQISPNQSGNYYIKISNRNHIATWSAMAVPFNMPTVDYNFTTSLLSAYQAQGGIDPQVQVAPGIFAFYLGDLDQNLGVDFDDFNTFEPYLTDGTYGFTIADFNGSALVDFDDFNLFEPLLNMGPFAQYPGLVK
ncbi:MAG: immunoglobulin domain-containing protein, partial [Bacteroidota bacterium]